jgi:hypothetical protein
MSAADDTRARASASVQLATFVFGFLTFVNPILGPAEARIYLICDTVCQSRLL